MLGMTVHFPNLKCYKKSILMCYFTFLSEAFDFPGITQETLILVLKAGTGCTPFWRSYIKMQNDFCFSLLHRTQELQKCTILAYPVVSFLAKPVRS